MDGVCDSFSLNFSFIFLQTNKGHQPGLSTGLLHDTYTSIQVFVTLDLPWCSSWWPSWPDPAWLTASLPLPGSWTDTRCVVALQAASFRPVWEKPGITWFWQEADRGIPKLAPGSVIRGGLHNLEWYLLGLSWQALPHKDFESLPCSVFVPMQGLLSRYTRGLPELREDAIFSSGGIPARVSSLLSSR